MKWHLTDSGIKSLPFKGETYHFKAQVQFSDDVDDQTKVTATGQTAIDKQTKTSNTVTNTIDNQATITVHHYMTDSTDKVAPDETVKVGYGKAYDVTKQVKTITGYKRNATLDEHTRGTASKTTKEAVMYYDPLPYNIHVNYLLTDGQKLDELDVTGLYGDTYTTEATDFEDLYTVDTDRLPTNAQGTVTEKPTTVNYYYQPTTGQWVDVGNQSSVLVRQDTKHNVRSVSQIYANDSGFTVKYNQDAAQVAIAASDTNGTQDNSLVFDYNSKYTFELSKNETVTFKVDDQGQVTATRVLGAEQTVTTFDKSGQLKTVTTVTNANGTKSQQTNTVDGLKSMVTGEQYDLGLLNGLKVTAQKEINPSQAATTESKTTTDTSQSGSNQSTSTTATDQTETNESTAGSSTNATNASSSVDASSANSQGDTEATSQSGTSASADSKTDSSVASSTSQTTDGKTDGETTNTGDTTTGTTTDSGLGFKSPFTEDQNTSSALGSAQTSNSLNSDTSAAVQALIAEPNSTPVVLGEDASFEEGVPVNDPVFSNDEGVSPNNNPSSAATPLAQATNTRARLTQNGKLLYEGTLQADQGEQNLYVSPDTTVEVDGGADGDGFYLDTYDGDKGMAYTLGSGYAWAAENNDVTAAPASSATTSSESAASESSTNSSDSSRTASSAADHSTSSASISDASQSSHSTSSSENSRSESSSSSSTTGDSADADKQAAARSSQTQSNSVNGSSQAVGSSTVTSQSSVPTKANTKQASSTPTTKANRATVVAATSSTAPRQSRATTASASVPSVTSASAAAASRAKQRSAFKKQHPILNQILPKTNSAVATWLVWLGVGLLILTVAITMVIKKRGRD
ncbi:MucBP domain-containing protein [Lactiplantibacillus plantarum]|uniref:MucBP domain-containing protein n=1 Tax=Lactiplantibacillus plantarum TaxID=1590 RepID=UPI0021C3BDD9|nr:MucBP domain-containing protein [Lactiplantibacillus plantarum]MCW6149169.1 MucBP domain-containing protein [Lactiplantibacillus plantarum]